MKRAILAFLCATIAATAFARAGTTGVLSGLVLDDSGKAVAGATVIAQSPSQGREVAHTDVFGRFIFLDLTPDKYIVSIEKQHYYPAAYAGVPIVADNALDLKFKLSPLAIEVSRDWTGPTNSTERDIYNVDPRAFTSLSNLVPGIAYSTPITPTGLPLGPQLNGLVTHADWIVSRGSWDETTISTEPFSGFPNPVSMTLTTIPGINMGFGGYPH